MCARQSETSFPGCHPNRQSHGTLGVDQLEERVEDETQDHVQFGDDAEYEFDMEAVVGALGPIEESDAIEFLATWQQTRTDTGEAQSKAERACTPTLEQYVNHQKRSKTRSREVGWSHSELYVSRSWPFQQKLSKETRPSTWK